MAIDPHAEIIGAIADSYLYSALRNDLPLGPLLSAADAIYPEEAPTAAVPPFVVYSIQAYGSDIRSTGSVRAAARPLYLVRVYHKTASWYGAILRAASAMDKALHVRASAEIVIPDPPVQGWVDGCWREEEFRQAEKHGEENWRALGGFYRLFIRPA